MRFLSWECWDFWIRHDHFRRFPKKSEVFRRSPKSAEGKVIEKTLIHEIRDREDGIVIYSFYTWFSFLTWVWVNIFLEIVSSKTATTHIFQSGVRNWPASVSRREIEVFNPQAWDSRLRRESWQVYVNSLKKKGLQFRFKLIYIINQSNVNGQIIPEYRGNDWKSPETLCL